MRACREESSVFNPTRFSWLSLRPKCLAGEGIFWKTWAQQNGFIDRSGNPSYGKVRSFNQIPPASSLRSIRVNGMLVQLTQNRLIGNLSNGKKFQMPFTEGHKQLKGFFDGIAQVQ